MQLSETFRAADSRVERTLVFVDMVGSAEMKDKEVEALWITHFGYFYDVVAEQIANGEAGTIVKYLGDGMMVAYGENDATAAINDAIRIQEAIKRGVEERQVRM